jgi:hypothetical protein
VSAQWGKGCDEGMVDLPGAAPACRLQRPPTLRRASPLPLPSPLRPPSLPLFSEDVSSDDLIDLIEGNRKYVRCLYVWNKVDMVSMEDVDRLARQPHSIVCSASQGMNLGRLVDRMWDYLGLTR